MKAAKQTTLRDHTAVFGIGVHSGLSTTLTLHPADADTGIVFLRTATAEHPEREIRADVRAVTATEFATVLGDGSGPLCSTAEHVLAALRGLGVDNAVVEIDGPKCRSWTAAPQPFVDAIDQRRPDHVSAPRRYIEVLKPIRVVQDKSLGELLPYAQRLPRRSRDRLRPSADRPSGDGARHLAGQLPPRDRRRPHVRLHARRRQIVERRLRARRVVREYPRHHGRPRAQPVGLRYPDEFVRHKILDAVGDLALAGAPLLGTYRVSRGGHRLNYAVLSALMADRSAWTVVDAEQPRRRGHADVGAGRMAPAYGPDVS